MAKQAIGIGTSANDGTGDPLRTAMDKTNDNFNEVYALFGDGSTLAISGDATVSAGALTIANDAVENAMIAAGAVDTTELAADAVDGTIRKEFAASIDENAVHGSDAPDTAKAEIGFFFSDKDLFSSFKKDSFAWISGKLRLIV